MAIKRIRAVQPYPVPKQAYYTQDQVIDTGPPTQILWDYPDGDPPPGATAINGMQGTDLYTCDICGRDVAESEFDGHLC